MNSSDGYSAIARDARVIRTNNEGEKRRRLRLVNGAYCSTSVETGDILSRAEKIYFHALSVGPNQFFSWGKLLVIARSLVLLKNKKKERVVMKEE